MATKAEKGRVSIMTKQQKKTLNLVLTYLVIILIGCVLLFPIAWMISAAFKTNDEIFGSIALMPKSFSFQNFIDGWKSAGIYTYATYFINSFIMVIPTTLLTIASSALVAYGFARFNFPFKKQLFAILIATLMLPNSVIIIPRYVLFNKFGWVDSYMPFWVPALLACYPFFIYQLIQFMRGIPRDLDESACIDGCGTFRIFWQILLPLMKPALFSAGLFQFLWTYNDYFNSLIFINSVKKYTISLALRLSVDAESVVVWGRVMAMACKAQTSGRIYLHSGPRTELHEIIRQEYARHQDRAVPRNTLRQAVQGMLDTFAYQNFDAAAGEYTNRCCRPPRETEMRPWRLVTEIGWTGGGVLAYPLVLCRDALGADAEAPLAAAMSGEQLFDRIADAYNENSGLLNDLMAPNAAGSQVNGWWTGYGLVKDCHCAYTVGSAVHYLTKTMDYLHQNGKPCPAKWMDAAQKVLHTVMDLQRADGAFGYTYSTQERKVLDWSGFAGCWFAPALVYLYRLTGEERCLHSAEKALHYYHTFVKDLNCYGTPMDTWKAVDEEGNLAFMRGSRLLYEQTGKAEFLQYMKDSAGYEFLWRYGYKTYPEHTPLNQGWSACGGAVTSVSNPHIHPMGVIIDTDLRYLARVTGDGYYASRAADSAAWMLQCLELYPAATGYGRYGMLSERWCPSDGLDVERFSDGRPFSSWFSHDLWASACVLEAACELLLEIEHKKG